jgi:hypothetical protein
MDYGQLMTLAIFFTLLGFGIWFNSQILVILAFLASIVFGLYRLALSLLEVLD